MKCIAPIYKSDKAGLSDTQRNALDLGAFPFEETLPHQREYYHTKDFPCGKCPVCTNRRASQWTFRLEQELKRSENAHFITFTYSDENLVWNLHEQKPTLYLPDFQKFLKRFRHEQSKYKTWKDKLKYYACGEYGEKTERPHFHAIFFNVPSVLSERNWKEEQGIYVPERMQKIWSKGHVHIGDVTNDSIRYVTGYVHKKIYKDSIGADPLGRAPEKSWMSKGLGDNYLTPETVKFMKKSLKPYITTENGRKVSMPRYYREKALNEAERLQMAENSYQEMLKREEPDMHEQTEWKKYLFYKRDKQNKLYRNKL